jgi:hypothetical protein
MNIDSMFFKLCNIPSDINEHLPTLFKYAKECESVLELGVRGCVSSWALAYGLLNNEKPTKKLLLNDINECDIHDLLVSSKQTDLVIVPLWVNDLSIQLTENVDLTFIDTWHVYGQLKRELEKFSKCTNKYIIMHDTTVDELAGESLRCGLNVQEQSINTGIPISEILQGLGKAVREFLENNTEWKLKEKFTNNNGLTVLEKIM